MELYAFNPGPLDDSVLYDQEKHVSSAVWEGQERGALRCHEHTSKLDQWTLSSRQIELIDKAGFGYLRYIPAISLDNPLISALVERWRRETNTFHLTVGEMTVTLEDVAFLLGLAIDGEPVIGVTYTTCESVCERFLGRAPEPGYTSGGMVKLSWLKECFSQCPEDATYEDIERHTRAYLLYLVGSTIFSTTTGNKVPVMYLPLFEDFDQCGNYAWGSAALAFLYRALGNASLRSQSTVSGSLTLLQCWSYYHLNIGRPRLTPEPIHDLFPLVLKWKGKNSGPTANRDITFYRKALDSLKPSEVDWFPYRDVDLSVIPHHILYSRNLGRSKTMLICFDKAERHLPDRCFRQYGMCQPIPPPVERWERKSRGVDGGVDLSKKMEAELREWAERYVNVVESGEVDESDYMHWYLKITRRFVGRPIPLASEFQRMNNTLREVAHIADTMTLQGLDNEQIESINRIRYTVHECLRDQAGSIVSVSSIGAEDENGKRGGRYKEKVRRRSSTVGKRRRKGEEFELSYVEDGKEVALLPNPSATEIDYVHIQQHDDPMSVADHHHHLQICGGGDDGGGMDDGDVQQLCQMGDDFGSNKIDDEGQICIPVSDGVSMDGAMVSMVADGMVDPSSHNSLVNHVEENGSQLSNVCGNEEDDDGGLPPQLSGHIEDVHDSHTVCEESKVGDDCEMMHNPSSYCPVVGEETKDLKMEEEPSSQEVCTQPSSTSSHGNEEQQMAA